MILATSFLRRTKDKYEDFCVAVSAPIFLLLLKPFGLLSGHLRPHTFDEALRVIDLKLGLDGFALTRFSIAHNWFYLLLETVYLALPLAMAVAWITSKSRTLLHGCVIGAFLAFPLYMLVPAAGPEFTFANWPFDGGIVTQPAMMYPRNCFPSLHLTWALLLVLNSKGAWRWVFGAYSALMALATIASGQHYAIDIVVALPFTFAVQAVSEWGWAKHATAQKIQPA